MGAVQLGELRGLQLRRPRDRRELSLWIAVFLGLRMPEKPLCHHHQTPLDYLAYSFFEGAESGGDAVVWACRGGGKTMLGAVATLLDLIFKPKIQVRILGGSFEQSEKMYGYLRQLVNRHFAHLLAQPATQRRLLLKNQSRVDVLAQSDRSVRGQRVQKLRCDEVELFDPEVWQAAQLTTRSLPENPPARAVTGAVEAFSTMHRPGGMMQALLAEIEHAAKGKPTAARRRVFAWCIWDVIERCPPKRECAACPLFDACGGRAKSADGFVPIDDVIAMRGRISKATWDHEMLCLPPHFEDAVFPAFRPETHVRPAPSAIALHGAVVDGEALRPETVICGVDFGYAHAFVCLWLVLLRRRDGKRVAWVLDELVTTAQTVTKNAAAMRARCQALALDPAMVYPDIAGQHVNSQTAKSDEKILHEAGFRTKAGTMTIVEGLELIGDWLEPAIGSPRLLIDSRCVRLIEAMERYRRTPSGTPDKDGRHDHLIDALRYALVNHERPPAKLDMRTY